VNDGLGRKQSFPYRRYHSCIYLDGLRKSTKDEVRLIGITAEKRIEHDQSTSQKHNSLSQPARRDHKEVERHTSSAEVSELNSRQGIVVFIPHWLWGSLSLLLSPVTGRGDP
jgi:hypothetical protein